MHNILGKVFLDHEQTQMGVQVVVQKLRYDRFKLHKQLEHVDNMVVAPFHMNLKYDHGGSSTPRAPLLEEI